MEILQENNKDKKTFFNHVFSTTEDGKAEILNTIQYSLLGVIPIVMLNKFISKFVPEANNDKSSIELLIEIAFQIIVMFCGVIIIHRIITYIPTYSGFKYENLVITNVVLAFLIIVLSIQTKLGIKVNILVDRLDELWNGTSSKNTSNNETTTQNNIRIIQPISQHVPSQADNLDSSSMQNGTFPPAMSTTSTKQLGSTMPMVSSFGPAPANGLIGSNFGS